MFENRQAFANPLVRRALTMAIDRETLVQAVLGGHGTVAPGPVGPWHWAYDPTWEALPYDPAAAAELLDEPLLRQYANRIAHVNLTKGKVKYKKIKKKWALKYIGARGLGVRRVRWLPGRRRAGVARQVAQDTPGGSLSAQTRYHRRGI